MALQARDDLFGFQEKIDKAVTESRETGKRIRLEFPKDKFLEQYPSAAGEPLVTLMKDKFVLVIEQFEEIKVGDLRKLCKEPNTVDSPLALEKRKSVLALEDERTVLVPRHELQALREGNASTTVIVPEETPQPAPPKPPPPNPEKVLQDIKKQAGEAKGGFSAEEKKEKK